MRHLPENLLLLIPTKQAKKHVAVLPSLIAPHALSGCDGVTKLYVIGKESSCESSGSQECTCYGSKRDDSMSQVRFARWGRKRGKKLTSNPKLESLPNTTEVFMLNVLRAHYQTCIWKSCLGPTPPNLDPCEYRLLKDERNGCLLPRLLPEGVSAATETVLQIIRCKCSSERPCSDGALAHKHRYHATSSVSALGYMLQPVVKLVR